ncbi:MAG: hypothetical protein J1F22_06970 [Lachnospiraceae bacterium]|nr:hypothetical protein [Lachnospiraceae bacterium]
MEFKRVAHRGFSSEAPENTRAAFALAVEGDFYGVECDIWKCLDGTYVVSHDGNLQRICGIDKEIPSMTYEEIRQYPITAGRKNDEHPAQYVICLSDYLSIVRRSDTIHPVIELKMDYTVVELREIVDLVKRYGLYERAYFISLYQSVLLRLKEELGFPTERLQYVYGAVAENREIPVSEELEQWLIHNRINLDTRHTLLSKENVTYLHDSGLEVNVWTVNDRELTERMIREWKVDMVTTEFYHEIL